MDLLHCFVFNSNAPWLPDDANPYIETPADHDRHMKVISLIHSGSNDWNIELLQSIFLPRDVGLILKIPISVDYEDAWSWRGDVRGLYSVKQGYRILTNIYEHEQSLDGSWSKIWKLKVPPNVQNFLWRCLHNVLPTLMALHSRRVDVEVACPLCAQNPETVSHLLCCCNKVIPLWQELTGSTPPSDANGFASWLVGSLSNHDAAMKVAAICWSIWKGRNNLIWKAQQWDYIHIKIQALHLIHAWSDLQLENIQHVPHDPGLNIMEGVSRVYVDAAVFEGDDQAYFGCVAFDSNGTYIGAKNGHIRCLNDILFAEVIAIREAMSWIKEIGISNVAFLSDCQVACNLLNSSGVNFSYAGCAIEACKEFRRHFEVVSFNYVRRSENRCAHAIARAAFSQSGPRVWISSIPYCIEHLI